MLSVGDDAHIVPANKTVFTETFGEFDGAQRVDVGIDPYALIGRKAASAPTRRRNKAPHAMREGLLRSGL